MQRQIEIEAILDDRHRDGSADFRQYFALDGSLRGAEELLNAKMLLDPLEEQSHLPAVLVERAHARGGDCVVGGQKYQRLAGPRMLEVNTAHPRGIAALSALHHQRHPPIVYLPGGAIDGSEVDALGFDVRFGAGDKEGAPFGQRDMLHINDMRLPVRDLQERWDGATQIEQRMRLDGGLDLAKRRPGEHRQTLIDPRGVRRVNGVGKVDRQQLVGIQSTDNADRRLEELAVSASIASNVPDITSSK